MRPVLLLLKRTFQCFPLRDVRMTRSSFHLSEMPTNHSVNYAREVKVTGAPCLAWIEDNRERLNQQEFEVELTSQSVTVRLCASRKAPHRRFYWAGFWLLVWIGGLCVSLFTQKFGEPNAWHDLVTYPVNSLVFIFILLILIGSQALIGLIFWRSVSMNYPSDETFYCDSSILTISKVRWLDVHNKDWKTRSYPIRKITGLKYQPFSRLRKLAPYGLRFEAAGRSERVLPGLGTHDADRIREAVKSFGVHVDE